MKIRFLGLLFSSVVAHQLTFAQGYTEETQLLHTDDGEVLTGRWTLPEANVKAVVVILQGSGNVGLDGDVSGPFTGTGYRGASAKLSDQIAYQLASLGVASFRYNKRGYENPQELPHQTAPYLISDAKSALHEARARYPMLKAGFVGLSEGALVAVHVAAQTPVDYLFLLSLPTRSIDEIFSYQVIQWPLEMLKLKVDVNRDGVISASEIDHAGESFLLPYLNAPLAAHDQDHNGSVAILSEATDIYRAVWSQIMGMMSTPAFSGWYQAMNNLPQFSIVAQKIHVPTYLYQAQDDAQVFWGWIESDRSYFGAETRLRRFSGVGHCFAPMDGVYGEIKTSGPLSDDVLSSLSSDILANI